jgi:hypothetical protein
MKTLQDFFQFILQEAPKKGEAPKNSELGAYAFAPTRADVPTPKEPNTKLEDQIKAALTTYFHKNVKAPLASQAEFLMGLVDKGYYSKVLSPGDYSTAYRLMRFDKDTFANLVGIDQVNMYGVLGGGVLNAQGGISGWTVNTKLFTKDGFDVYADGDVVAIFIAPIDSNRFFGNPDYLAKAIGEPHYSYEMETIAVGPVNYLKCCYALLSPREMDDPQLQKIRIIRMLSYAGVK